MISVFIFLSFETFFIDQSTCPGLQTLQGINKYTRKYLVLVTLTAVQLNEFIINVFQSEFEEQGGKVGITINTNWGEPVEANNPEHQEASDRYLSYQFYQGCGVAQSGCGVAQLVVRRLAVRQARV